MRDLCGNSSFTPSTCCATYLADMPLSSVAEKKSWLFACCEKFRQKRFSGNPPTARHRHRVGFTLESRRLYAWIAMALRLNRDGFTLESRRLYAWIAKKFKRKTETTFSIHFLSSIINNVCKERIGTWLLGQQNRRKISNRYTTLIINHLVAQPLSSKKIFWKKVHESFVNIAKSRTFAPAKQQRGRLGLGNVFVECVLSSAGRATDS